MIYERIDLYDYFKLPRGDRKGGYLTAYARSRNPEIKEKIRPAMLVVPGGGYEIVSDREGEPIAIRFVEQGYSAFVLNYTVRVPYPVPLIEAAMAAAYIRKEREKYFVDPEKVGVIGFSAGGHLAGMLATLYGEEPVLSALKGDAALVRPDAAVLSYAVLTTGEKTHEGTARNISGGDMRLRAALSIPDRVRKDNPPMFLWHTATDSAVPVENTFEMAKACAKAGVPYEVHVFEKGPHGISCADAETSDGEGQANCDSAVSVWLPLLFTWLSRRGFTVRLRHPETR